MTDPHTISRVAFGLRGRDLQNRKQRLAWPLRKFLCTSMNLEWGYNRQFPDNSCNCSPRQYSVRCMTLTSDLRSITFTKSTWLPDQVYIKHLLLPSAHFLECLMSTSGGRRGQLLMVLGLGSRPRGDWEIPPGIPARWSDTPGLSSLWSHFFGHHDINGVTTNLKVGVQFSEDTPSEISGLDGGTSRPGGIENIND